MTTQVPWYNIIDFWHYIFILVMGFILWQGVAQNYPRAFEHAKARLNYVNFFVIFTLGILFFSCGLYVYHPTSPDVSWALMRLSFLVWTWTICVILWHSKIPKWAKGFSLLMVIGALLIDYIYTERITGFLKEVDAFILMGGEYTGTGLRPSILLTWIFFFIHAFVFLHYYGLMYEINYREKIKRGERKEGLQEDAINRAIIVLSMSFSFFVALVLVGTDLGKLSLFSGLVAAGVSIALRDLLANMAAGILLLWDKSIKLRDVISLDKERYGVVHSMTIRYLVLEDRNDIRFLVPNSDLVNQTITNWTQKTRNVRLKLDFGVAYDSEIEKVKDIMKAVCLRHSRVLQNPPPRVLILGLGDSTINFQLRLFIADPENGIRNVLGELYEALLERFKEAKISIPFPQREIKLLPDSSVSIKQELRPKRRIL
jgi:small-conductance mechanosensitive channel